MPQLALFPTGPAIEGVHYHRSPLARFASEVADDLDAARIAGDDELVAEIVDQAKMVAEVHRLSRTTDPDTSKAAARSAGATAAAHAAAILETLRAAGEPLAAEQVADRTGLSSIQVARRWAALIDADLVERTTDRHRNRNGRSAAKHKVTT